MKLLRNALLILTAAILIVAAAAIPFMPRIALWAFASTNGLDIRYDSLKRATITSMAFEGLTVTDKANGFGVSSRDGSIDIAWEWPDLMNPTVGFDLYDVRFVKKSAEAASSYNTLDGLVALPFNSDWVYKEISGKVHSSKDGVKVDDFMAKSDMMKLAFSGEMNHDNTIKSDIVIYFSDQLTKKIPPELIKLILTQADPGWKSLSVKLEGNYTMPTIQVSSKLFRLNIGVKEDRS